MDPRGDAQRITDGVLSLLGARGVGLYEREGGGDHLAVLAVSGDDGAVLEWLASVPAGASPLGRAASERRAVATEDLLADPALRLQPEVRGRIERTGVRALLCVPLVFDDEVIGALVVADRAGRGIDAEQRRLVEALADQAAVALEGARMYRATRGRLRAAETVLAVTQAVGSTLDLTEVLRRTVREMTRALGADMGGAWLLSPQGDRYLPLVGYHVPKALLERFSLAPLELADPLVQELRRQAGPICSSNSPADRRFEHAVARLFPHRSLMVQPVRVRSELIGGFAVAWTRGPHRFSPDELQLAEVVAGQAAIAIEKARLFAETERRGEAAESLAAVGRVISQSLNADEVGQRIVDSVRTLVGAPRATLTRVDAETAELRVLAISGEEAFPLGTGIAALAINGRCVVATPDLLSEPRITLTADVRAHCERVDVRAVLAVPLTAGEVVIGALAIGDRAGRVFGGEDIRLLETFADQAAIAIHNADLYAETRRQQEEAVVLEAVARDLTASLEREDVLQRIVERARELCRSDLASLAPWDPVKGAAVIAASAGEDAAALAAVEVRPGRGAGGRVLETGEPFVTDDYVRDPRISKEFAPVAAQRGIVTLAVVPLRFGKTITGLLWVANRTPRRFTRRDVAVLGKLADHAAIALENSRLYATAEELAVSRERVRLAAELHDTLSQMLFSTALKLEWSLGRLGDRPEVREKIQEVKRDTGVMMNQLRALIYQLSSGPPTTAAPARQFQQIVEQFRELTGLPVEFAQQGDLGRLDPERQEVLHRTIQEALANIAKHARATHASVRLDVGADAAVFEVVDDGVGPVGGAATSLDVIPGHLGLRLIFRRIEALGGRVEFGRTFPSGFRVRGRLPLR